MLQHQRRRKKFFKNQLQNSGWDTPRLPGDEVKIPTDSEQKTPTAKVDTEQAGVRRYLKTFVFASIVSAK
jgi:hypothetical protein